MGRTVLSLVWALTTSILIGSMGPSVASDPVQAPGMASPEVFEHLGALDGLQAFALRSDGRVAAIAMQGTGTSGRNARSSVRLLDAATPDDVRELEVPGQVRALLFGSDGREVFGIVYRAKKKRTGDAHLFRIDLATWKFERGNRLPPTARSLDHWLSKDAIVIASKDELRTVFVNGMRSGPLYKVPGRNLSVASVTGGSLLLVGQDDSLVLLDLEDPPGQDAMPIRERVDAPEPVTAIAVSPRGDEALARLLDGRLYQITFGPLGWTDRGEGVAIASPTREQPSTSRPPVAPLAAEPVATEPVAAEPEPAPTITQTSTAAAATVAATSSTSNAPDTPAADPTGTPPPPPPAPVVVADPSPAPTQDAAIPGEPDADPAEPDAEPAMPDAEPAPEETAPEAAATAAPEGTAILGRIDGEAALVQWVILLGPNNMIREAARVAPRDGGWVADDLSPGRYRVQLDGGPNLVLVTDPPYLLVEVAEDEAAEAPLIRVIRGYAPADRR